jgi:hypothetical protein
MEAPRRLESQADWKRLAACQGEDPELWFTTGEDAEELAIQICDWCPVVLECLNASEDEEFGVWGGMTEEVRQEMKKMKAYPPKAEAQVPSLGAGRRLRALAHLGWTHYDIATDIRRYSGIPVRPVYIEELRDDLHATISEDLHADLDARQLGADREACRRRGLGNRADVARPRHRRPRGGARP